MNEHNLMKQATLALAAGNYENARAAATRLVETDEPSPEAYWILHLAQVGAGREEAAHEAISEYIRLEPDGWKGWAYRARARHTLGDNVGAMSDADRAVELSDGSPTPYDIRAELLHRQDRHLEAIDDEHEAKLRRATNSEERDQADHQRTVAQLKARVDLCLRSHDSDGARDLLRELLRLEGEDPVSRFNLACKLYELGEYKEAAEELHRAFMLTAPAEDCLRGYMITTNPAVVDDIIGFVPAGESDSANLQHRVLSVLSQSESRVPGPVRVYCYHFIGHKMEVLPLSSQESMTLVVPPGQAPSPPDVDEAAS